MPEVWATVAGVVGAATAVAGTAYSIAQSNSAIDAANSVRLPQFQPIKIKKLAGDPATGSPGLMANTDLLNYSLSQKDWQERLPDLAEAKQATLDDTLAASQGKLPKAVNAALDTAGLSADLGNNPFQQAMNLGLRDTEAIQKMDRNKYTKSITMNPQIQIGASGGDVVNMMQANTEGAFNFNETVFGAKMGQYNSQIAQAAQNTSAGISAIGGLASIGNNLYQNYDLSRALNNQAATNPNLDVNYYHPYPGFAQGGG